MANDQINTWGKIIAGICLIFFSSFSLILLVGLWPDKLPPTGAKCELYYFKLFHVRLLDSADCCPPHVYEAMNKKTISAAPNDKVGKSDSLTKDSSKSALPAETIHSFQDNKCCFAQCTIHFNTLLLLLVGLGGFLGNMIHITKSFTTFVGNNKFQKSWILWYWINPITAAALAIAVYLVCRGGFMTLNGDGSNLNIYGIVSAAILTGLFTDRATLKLEEIFKVIFKTDDNRTGKLNGGFSVTGISPLKLDKVKTNNIVISGSDLSSQKITINVENVPIAQPTISSDKITFSYTLSDADKNKPRLKLAITDGDGKEIYTRNIDVDNA
jgi:hypothetical protein